MNDDFFDEHVRSVVKTGRSAFRRIIVAQLIAVLAFCGAAIWIVSMIIDAVKS